MYTAFILHLAILSTWFSLLIFRSGVLSLNLLSVGLEDVSLDWIGIGRSLSAVFSPKMSVYIEQ